MADENRIVGRDTEIESVAEEIGAVVRDDPPNNAMIYGKREPERASSPDTSPDGRETPPGRTALTAK